MRMISSVEQHVNDISLATGQYTILCARTQVIDPGPQGPLVCLQSEMNGHSNICEILGHKIQSFIK